MSGLARWCFRHRRLVVVAWLLATVAVIGVGRAAGSDFGSSFSLPDTDSQAAVTLLTHNFPAASGEGDQIVIQATHGGAIKSAAVRTSVTEALAKVAAVPGVESVASPYAKADSAQVSQEGTIAFAAVTWDKQSAQVTTAEADRLIKAAESADSSAVHISLSGQSITNSERPSPGFTVGVGVIAALAVLLVIFGGSVLAALLPLLGAGLALILGNSLIGLLSHAMSISSVSTELAVLIGLGVGVDYGLFIISRYRSAVKQGTPYADAAALAVATSGRTVLLAGLTVCIALLGQFLLGVSFLYGVSVSAAIAVALTMATALTLLPAMLGFLGPRVLSRRERARLTATGRHATPAAGGFWLGWARFVERRKVLVALGSLAAVVAIALPIFGLRLGTSDASTDPTGSTTHQAYTALARGFGPGFNGPLELVAQAGSARDLTAFDQLLGTVAHASGVASVSPAVTSPNGKVLVASVYPTTSPQAGQTVSLVNGLRDHLIPRAADGTSLIVHVGGETATNIDFAHVLADKLPIFVIVVVLLAFLLLMAVFRSLLIPLVASVMNLLSVGAALGAMNAVFSWGWGSSLLHLSGTGPVDAFLPVLIFSVLFGLSMDYEVYLISRIQEEWRQRVGGGAAAGAAVTAAERNHRAVTIGLAKSGPVIAAAASIMILVFGSFMFGGARELAEFGFGLAFSVLVDALLIRSLLVPALMHIIGPVNWALPRGLDRVLPRLAVEAPEGAVAEAGTAGPGHTAPNLVFRDWLPRRAAWPLAVPGRATASGRPCPTNRINPLASTPMETVMTRRKTRTALTAFSLAGIALLLAACSATSDSTSAGMGAGMGASAPVGQPIVRAPGAGTPAAAAELRGSYVALGDSYTAGLDIPDQTGATAGCGQSSSSYPFLVARSLRLELTDMSCSSATVASLSAAQATGDGTNPPQLSALSAATALVTLGIGGNDVGWAGIVTRCTELDLIPALIPGHSASDLAPCQDYYTSGGTDQIQQRISAVTGQLAEALTQIRQRAPHARVYVVGYPDLLPSSGGCGDTLGITKGDVAFLDNEELRLNGMLRQAAQTAGDGYVDTYTPSQGHDACVAPADRWIEPLIPDAAAAPLHPNAVGEQGMADTIVGAVRASA